jgi:surface polysaccharide O-acyltransferase-like enzyme
MQLITYNGEYFERSKLRYVIFFLVVGAVMIGSVLSKNTIGAVIILLFVGGYFFFLTKTNETTALKIEEN